MKRKVRNLNLNCTASLLIFLDAQWTKMKFQPDRVVTFNRKKKKCFSLLIKLESHLEIIFLKDENFHYTTWAHRWKSYIQCFCNYENNEKLHQLWWHSHLKIFLLIPRRTMLQNQAGENTLIQTNWGRFNKEKWEILVFSHECFLIMLHNRVMFAWNVFPLCNVVKHNEFCIICQKVLYKTI